MYICSISAVEMFSHGSSNIKPNCLPSEFAIHVEPETRFENRKMTALLIFQKTTTFNSTMLMASNHEENNI